MLIFHGDNQLASRDAFLNKKIQAEKSGFQVVQLSGHDLTLSELIISCETVSIFGSNNSIFIDSFFSRRPGSDKKDIQGYLLKNLQSDITIWEPKNMSLQLKDFPPQVIQKFEYPKSIFTFLENFNLVNLLRTLQNTPPEQLLPIIAGQIHKLILVKENKINLPSWQLSKLQSQAGKYTTKQLLAMQTDLTRKDFIQKTSSTPYGLATALELWVLSL